MQNDGAKPQPTTGARTRCSYRPARSPGHSFLSAVLPHRPRSFMASTVLDSNMHTLALINVHTSSLHRRYADSCSFELARGRFRDLLLAPDNAIATFSTCYEFQKPASPRPNHHRTASHRSKSHSLPHPPRQRLPSNAPVKTAQEDTTRVSPRVSGRGSPDRVLSFLRTIRI